MPAEFDKMVDAIKKSLKKDNPNMKPEEISSKAFAIATANWKKSHGGKGPREKLKDWRILEFVVPIEESVLEGDDFMIRGVAINETTTLNNVKYVAEELMKAAPSFRDVPILEDHENKVRKIVGRTTENVDFNSTFKRIDFEAKIMDNDIKEMIKDGRIGSVSIGAKVQDLTEEEDGSMKAIGIHGLEISLVAVPGDSQANLAQAIKQGYHLKEVAMLDNKLNKKEDKMADEETSKTEPSEGEEATAEEPAEAPAEESKEAPEEKSEGDSEEKSEEKSKEKIQKIDVKIDTSELSEMKSQISEIKEMLKEKKEIREDIKTDATKGEVKEGKVDKLKELDHSIFEKADNGKGFMIYQDYSFLGKDTKLKRLVR